MRARLNMHAVPGTTGSAREADLPGGVSTHYYLCDQTTRFACTNIPALRAVLADLACGLCDGVEFPAAITAALHIQPVLVACLKNWTNPNVRVRLVFDLDCDDDANIPGQLPAPAEIHRRFMTWLGSVWSEVDWLGQPCAIFAGSFADKPASAHVWFPNFCFEPVDSNRFNQQESCIDRLNALFADCALKIDKSIHSGGLKYPYMDKWIKGVKRYRGAAQQLVLAHNLVIDSWLELYNTFDPLVISSDAAWHNTLNFPPVAQRRHIAPAVPVATVYIQPIGQIDDVLKRLYKAVPQWDGKPVTRKQARQGQGLEILCVDDAYCPLRQRAHTTAGASYVVLRLDHTLVVKCHKAKCVAKVLEFANDAVDAIDRPILERFNDGFAKLQGDAVAQLPVRLMDGTFSKLKVMTHKQFVAQKSIMTEMVGKLYYPTYWLRHPLARQYELGICCSPKPRDPRYYNTWMGIRADVADATTRLVEATASDLRSMCPNYLRLVEQNICGADELVIKYVFDWFADCFQRPGNKPGVALVLTGPPGCGKGLTANMLVNIYGNPHGVAICSKDLNGNFNSLYSETCLLFIDEMEKVKKQKLNNAALKNLITETKGVHNEKYVPERVVEMFQHIIMASNGGYIVQMQNNERRYFIQQCAYLLGEPGSPEYLQFCALVAAELENVSAMAALYTLLMRRDLTGYMPMIHPFTKAHWHAHYLSMSKPEKFVYRVLFSGNICLRELAPTMELKDHIESLCGDWTGLGNVGVAVAELGFDVFSRNGLRYPKDLWELGYRQHFPDRNDDCSVLWREALFTLAPAADWQFSRVQTSNGRCNTFIMPSLDILRAKFVQNCGNADAQIWTAEWAIE